MRKKNDLIISFSKGDKNEQQHGGEKNRSYPGCSSWKMPCNPRMTIPHSGIQRRSHDTRHRSACRLSLRQMNMRRISLLPLLHTISSPVTCYSWWRSCREKHRLCDRDNLTLGILACHSLVISPPTGSLLLKMSPQPHFSQQENSISIYLWNIIGIQHHAKRLVTPPFSIFGFQAVRLSCKVLKWAIVLRAFPQSFDVVLWTLPDFSTHL